MIHSPRLKTKRLCNNDCTMSISLSLSPTQLPISPLVRRTAKRRKFFDQVIQTETVSMSDTKQGINSNLGEVFLDSSALPTIHKGIPILPFLFEAASEVATEFGGSQSCQAHGASDDVSLPLKRKQFHVGLPIEEAGEGYIGNSTGVCLTYPVILVLDPETSNDVKDGDSISNILLPFRSTKFDNPNDNVASVSRTFLGGEADYETENDDDDSTTIDILEDDSGQEVYSFVRVSDEIPQNCDEIHAGNNQSNLHIEKENNKAFHDRIVRTSPSPEDQNGDDSSQCINNPGDIIIPQSTFSQNTATGYSSHSRSHYDDRPPTPYYP